MTFNLLTSNEKEDQDLSCTICLPSSLMIYPVIFLLRDARSAKHSIAIVSRPFVRLSVMLKYNRNFRKHKGWTSSKLITRRVYAPRSHNIDNLVQREHLPNSGGMGAGPRSQQKTETGQDRAQVTIDDQ